MGPYLLLTREENKPVRMNFLDLLLATSYRDLHRRIIGKAKLLVFKNGVWKELK